MAQALDLRSSPHGDDLLSRLLHELRSPLSLILLAADIDDSETCVAAAQRMEQLLRYAGATRTQAPVEVAAALAREEVEAAACLLNLTSVFLGHLLVQEPDEGEVLLPRDPELRSCLVAGWLEAACYGAPTEPMVVRVKTTGVSREMEALCGGQVRRRVSQINHRLGPLAAGTVARGLGGRLVVSSARPSAVLVLPASRAARPASGTAGAGCPSREGKGGVEACER